MCFVVVIIFKCFFNCRNLKRRRSKTTREAFFEGKIRLILSSSLPVFDVVALSVDAINFLSHSLLFSFSLSSLYSLFLSLSLSLSFSHSHSFFIKQFPFSQTLFISLFLSQTIFHSLSPALAFPDLLDRIRLFRGKKIAPTSRDLMPNYSHFKSIFCTDRVRSP